MKIKPKAAIADWHHVNAPWLLRLSIDPDEYRHRLAPARLEFRRTLSTDQYVRIDAVDFDQTSKMRNCHWTRGLTMRGQHCEYQSNSYYCLRQAPRPILSAIAWLSRAFVSRWYLRRWCTVRSEEHTSELQSLAYLVCRLLLEKKK